MVQPLAWAARILSSISASYLHWYGKMSIGFLDEQYKIVTVGVDDSSLCADAQLKAVCSI